VSHKLLARMLFHRMLNRDVLICGSLKISLLNSSLLYLYYLYLKAKLGIFYLDGNHGYNNSEPDVQPFFIAQGPNIRRNLTLPFGYSVDVYPLMCSLLGIEPQPNNGSLERIRVIIEPRSNVELFGLFILKNSNINIFFIYIFKFYFIF